MRVGRCTAQWTKTDNVVDEKTRQRPKSAMTSSELARTSSDIVSSTKEEALLKAILVRKAGAKLLRQLS